jgi:hypothetical protein
MGLILFFKWWKNNKNEIYALLYPCHLIGVVFV